VCVDDSAQGPFKMTDDFGPVKATEAAMTRQRRRQRLHSVHCYIARTSVAAVAVSAAMFNELSVQTEDSFDISPSWKAWSPLPSIRVHFESLITHVFAWLQDAVKTLAEAIGRPPRMPLCDQDPPSALLWAVDLFLIFSLAAAVLFILSFTADNSPKSEGGIEEATSSSSSVSVSSESRLIGRLRVFAVFMLSALSGGVLNVRHPIKSTLLLGM
jgi:hypothetical protein